MFGWREGYITFYITAQEEKGWGKSLQTQGLGFMENSVRQVAGEKDRAHEALRGRV